MNTEEQFQSVLEESAKILGMNCPEVDALGTCSFNYRNDFHLSIIAPPFTGFVHLAAPVCLLDELGTEHLYRCALETNYMLVETGGATLAVDSHLNQLLLCMRIPIETLTAEHLANALISLGHVAEQMRGKFKTQIEQEELAEEEEFHAPPGMDIIEG